MNFQIQLHKNGARWQAWLVNESKQIGIMVDESYRKADIIATIERLETVIGIAHISFC